MTEALAQGAIIGILGGGQLGRMLAVAAARLGYRCHIFEPGAEPPAGQVAWKVTTAPYDDAKALTEFAQSVDVVTFEFENVPAEALDLIEAHCPIRPNRKALATSQDRLVEKEFLTSLDLSVAPFANVESPLDMAAAVSEIGAPSILKTRRFGYDGKGQSRLGSKEDADQAWADMAGAPSVLEGFVDFSHEVSVIGARSAAGDVACFDPGENLHKAGILRTTRVPARLSPAQRTDAILIAARILNALEYVGVMGVELFVTPGGLIVNEIAPRVHNSGHWTQNGCLVDQFEQHIRAVTGLPLSDATRHADIEMENLIGSDMDRLAEIIADPNAALHLYGKAEVKSGRKMGHVNRLI